MLSFARVTESGNRLTTSFNLVRSIVAGFAVVSGDPSNGASGRAEPRWRTPAIVAGLMLVLAALGIWTISRAPFWLDEASAILSARGSLDTLDDAYGPNQAFYILVLHFWRLVGESELRLRLLSVMCAVATVPALYLLGRTLLGKRAALAGCFLFATNAFVVVYMQQVRPYTLLLLLLVVATLFYLDAMKRSSWTTWTLYGVVMAAALWTNFFAGFVFLAHAVGFVTRRPWPRLLPAVPAIALIIAAATPIGVFVGSTGRKYIDGWIAPTSPAAVLDAMTQVAGAGPLRLALSAVLIVLSLVALGLASKRWPVGLLLAWVVLPFAGAILISLVSPVFLSRYMLLTAPAIALLAGAGLATLRPAPAVLVGAAILLTTAPTLIAHYDGRYDDWRGAAAYVATYARAGDRIVFDDPLGEKPFVIYLERNRHAPLVTVPTQEASPASRVWLVFWRHGYNETTEIRNAMGKYKAVINEAFGGVHVQLAVPR